MTAYELMIKTNHYLIKGGDLNEAQKRNIVSQLLNAKSTPEQARRFYIGVKFPDNTDSSGRHMYPLYFIPPYNDGKKYKTILGQTPQTHILSANMYELEILRLLYLFAPDNAEIKEMTSKTLERLKTTASYIVTTLWANASFLCLSFCAFSPRSHRTKENGFRVVLTITTGIIPTKSVRPSACGIIGSVCPSFRLI